MTWWRQHTSSSDGNPPPWGAWWKRSPCSFFSLGLAHHICQCSVCFFASQVLFQALEMLLIHSILCPLSSLSLSLSFFPFKLSFLFPFSLLSPFFQLSSPVCCTCVCCYRPSWCQSSSILCFLSPCNNKFLPFYYYYCKLVSPLHD